MKLESASQWKIIKIDLLSKYAYYTTNHTMACDRDVIKMINNFDTLIPEISKAEVVARTTPKFYKLKELLHNFNTNLQDCEEIFLLRVLERNM